MHSYSHITAFDYLYNNQDIWEKILGREILDSFYKKEIIKQISETFYYIYNMRVYADDLIRKYDNKYSKYGKDESVKFLLRQWINYDPKNAELEYLINTYVDSSFLSKYTSLELNNFAWAAFQKIPDTAILNKALLWSKKSLEQDKANPMYLDTYANLLYKLGNTNEAIEIETKALELVEEAKKKSYQEVLDKMKSGKPTW